MANNIPDISKFYDGDGTTKQFGVTFDYLDKAYVFVEVGGVSAPFTWVSDAVVELAAPPPVGVGNVHIYRSTLASSMLAVFSDDTPFLAKYVDQDNTQLLHLIQETAANAAVSNTDYEAALEAEAAARSSGDAYLQSQLTGHSPSITPYVNSMAALLQYPGEREGQHVLMGGYYTGSNQGGGLFVWRATSTATADGGVVVAATGKTTGRWVRQVTGNEVLLSWWGAKEGADAGAPLTAAINWSKLNGFLTIVIDFSKVVISAQLPRLNGDAGDETFKTVRLRGRGNGYERTEIDCTSAPDGCIWWRRGSGGIAGVALEGLFINAGTDRSPLLNQGCGGVRILHCEVLASTAWVITNNIGAGTFSEFCVFDGCFIKCRQLFQFTRGAGDNSFHGCGCVGQSVVNILNLSGDSTLGAVVLGGAGDSGISVLYNSPWDCTFFVSKSGPFPLFARYNGGDNSWMSITGSIRLESSASANIVFAKSDNRVFITAQISGLSNTVSLGSAQACQRVDCTSSGAPVAHLTSRYIQFKKPAAASSVTLPMPTDESGLGRVVQVLVTGSNYRFGHVLTFSRMISSGIPGAANVLATNYAFNQSGGGAPNYGISGNNLTIYSSNATWVAAELTVNVLYLDGINSTVLNGSIP